MTASRGRAQAEVRARVPRAGPLLTVGEPGKVLREAPRSAARVAEVLTHEGCGGRASDPRVHPPVASSSAGTAVRTVTFSLVADSAAFAPTSFAAFEWAPRGDGFG